MTTQIITAGQKVKGQIGYCAIAFEDMQWRKEIYGKLRGKNVVKGEQVALLRALKHLHTKAPQAVNVIAYDLEVLETVNGAKDKRTDADPQSLKNKIRKEILSLKKKGFEFTAESHDETFQEFHEEKNKCVGGAFSAISVYKSPPHPRPRRRKYW